MLTPSSVDSFKNAISGLSKEQATLVLSTKGLKATQQEQVLVEAGLIATSDKMSANLVQQALMTEGLDKEQRESILTKAGLMNQDSKLLLSGEATSAQKLKLILMENGYQEEQAETLINSILQTGQNGKEALSWKVLGTRIKETTASMAAWLFTTPVGVFTLIAGGLAVATLAVTKYNEKLEENRQKMIEAGKEASQLNKDLDGLVEQYRKLGEDGKFDNSDREQAKNIQQQINDLLGDEVNYIDLVNGGYKEQLNWLRQIQYEKAKDNYKKINDAKTAAEDSLLAITPKVTSGFNSTSDESKAIKQVLKEYGFDKYISTSENNNSASQIIHFAIDNSSAESTIQSLEDMKELRDVLRKSYEGEISTGGDLEDFYNNLDKKIGELSESVTKYKDALSDYNVNEAVIQFNEEKFGNITGALIHNEKELKRWLSSMLSSKSITDGVRAELVTLAKTSFPELNSAIEETTSAFIKNNAVKLTSQDVDDGNIDSLWKLGKQAGLTEKEIVDLISTQIIFNNNSLSVAGKVQALAELATQLGVTTSAAIGLNNALAGNTDPTGRSQMYNTAQAYGVKWDVKGWSYNGTVYKSMGAAIQAAMSAEARGWVGGNVNSDTPPHSPSGDKDKGKDDKPNYEDPTDAIINRINLRSKELEQQEESIQNAIEIAELENDYKKQISLTNDLIDIRKKRIDELQSANNKLHAKAEELRNSTPQWNEEEWFDSQGNATEAYNSLYNSSSKVVQEKLKDQFERISKIKQAWVDNNDTIQDLTKENIKSIEDISDIASEALENHFDERNEISEHWIQTQTDFDQLAIDGQIEAYARMVRNNREFLKEIEKNEHLSAEERDRLWKETSDKIVDYQLEAYNLVKKAIQQYSEEVEKGYDIRISRLNSESSLLSSHFDLINAISEEQHNLNKELAEAEVAGAKMNKIERQTLFTKEEHAKLTDKLNGLLGDAVAIQSDYLSELETATKETIEEITNNYERQYELKMKEYEVVKAELALVKAEQRLKNVENEKSVRTWDGTKWVYEADFQDVVDAKLAVEDAKYAVWQAQTSQAQQTALNAIDSTADSLETQKNLFAETLEELSGETKITGQQLTEALKYIAEVDLPTFEKIIEQFGDSLSEAFDVDVDSVRGSAGGSSSSGMPLNSSHLNYSRTVVQMKANSAAYASATPSEQAALHSQNASLAAGIGATFNGGTGHWEINGSKLYANGSKSTQKGLGIFDENGIGSEYVLTKDGILHNFNMGDKVFNPKMGDNLYEAAQIDWKKVSLADFGGLASIDNSIRNMSSDTYYNVNGVNINSEEGGEIKGFVKFLKAKKI